MLRALKAFLGRNSAESATVSRERELRLATAVLLVEVARADFAEQGLEIEVVTGLLEQHLGMSRTETEALVAEARREADVHATLQGFTRQLHEELDREEKLRVLEMLWRVAQSDGTLEKHEDHLIRKVAGLLYVSHSDLIRVRNRVAERA